MARCAGMLRTAAGWRAARWWTRAPSLSHHRRVPAPAPGMEVRRRLGAADPAFGGQRGGAGWAAALHGLLLGRPGCLRFLWMAELPAGLRTPAGHAVSAVQLMEDVASALGSLGMAIEAMAVGKTDSWNLWKLVACRG